MSLVSPGEFWWILPAFWCIELPMVPSPHVLRFLKKVPFLTGLVGGKINLKTLESPMKSCHFWEVRLRTLAPTLKLAICKSNRSNRSHDFPLNHHQPPFLTNINHRYWPSLTTTISHDYETSTLHTWACECLDMGLRSDQATPWPRLWKHDETSPDTSASSGPRHADPAVQRWDWICTNKLCCARITFIRPGSTRVKYSKI